MTQITIIGLGLVGGSLGMALEESIRPEKGRERPVRIVGYDPDPAVAVEARGRGAIDQVAQSLQEAVHEADIVIIAQPAPQVGETLSRIGPLLPAGCIVTDTASTKVAVTRWAEEYLPAGVGFVGGHPIPLPQHDPDYAGGIQKARPDLFQGAVYCLTPTTHSPPQSVDAIADLARIAGASPFFLDPAEHDGLLAGTSQAPYIVAAAMLSTIAHSASWRDLKLLADPTFRRLSQILAARPADFYRTCLTNRQPLVSWLDRVIVALYEVRRELAEEGSAGEHLEVMVRDARAAYEDWLRRRDERRKEIEDTAAQTPSAAQTMAGLFLPRVGRLRPGERKD